MEQAQPIDCGAILDITVVSQWREQVLAVLQKGEPVILKADEIQRIDAAGLQAILGLFISAEHKSISIQWENPSPVIQQAAGLLGLTDYLHLNS